jgi:hypothetical protein
MRISRGKGGRCSPFGEDCRWRTGCSGGRISAFPTRVGNNLDPRFGLALSGPPGCESFAQFRRPSAAESPLISPCCALSNPPGCGSFARFRRPSAAESLLFACPKRSNQEKGHPGAAPCGHPVLRVRASAPGFSDGTSVYRRKTRALPVRDPAGLFSAAAPRHRGPGKSGALLRAEAAGVRTAALDPALDPPPRFWRRAAQPGSGERRHCLRPGMAEFGAGPRPASSAGDGPKARARVGRAFSWLLLFARAKRSDSAAEGRRNRAKVSHSGGLDSANPNSRSRWIPASAGTTARVAPDAT